MTSDAENRALELAFRFLLAGGHDVLEWDEATGGNKLDSLKLVYEDALTNPERLESVLARLTLFPIDRDPPMPETVLTDRTTYPHKGGAVRLRQPEEEEEQEDGGLPVSTDIVGDARPAIVQRLL